MAEKNEKGFLRGPKADYMIQDEITEYFSRDLQFDWPEAYEPPYPLTRGEAKLLYSNHTGAVPRPLEIADAEKVSEVDQVRKEMWSQPSDTPEWTQTTLDKVLCHVPGRPHEKSLVIVKSGSPEEIKAYLDGLDSRDRLYVYSAAEKTIMMVEQYLSRFDTDKEK